MLFKDSDVPRAKSCTAEKYPSSDFQSSVDRFHLRRRLRTTGGKPVHGIHEDGDSQGLGLHVGEDVFERVGVDAEVV